MSVTNFDSGYDLCMYQKFDYYEHGPWDILGIDSGNNILRQSIKRNYNTDNINNSKLVPFFCNKNLIYSSYIGNQIELKDMSLKEVNEYNTIRSNNQNKNTPKNNIELGFMYKYQFADMIIGIDKTYVIVGLQRKFREIQRLKKIKANIIHRYWRICSWDPSYKLGKRLVIKRAELENSQD